MHRSRSTDSRRWIARLSRAALAATLLTALAACAGDTTGPDDTAAPSGQGPWPVVIEHKYGSTSIPKAPTRVVTLGLSDQDTVLALGIKPVGAVDWFGERPFGNWAWVKDKWGDTPPEIVGERDEYEVEKIIELNPDLIIAQYSGMKKEQYDTLSKIAPVVAQSNKYDDYAAPWDEMTRVIGRALGQEEQTEKLLADIDKRLADIRNQHPEFAQQTVIVTDPFEPGVYATFASTDPKAQLLAEMGFKLSPEIDQLAGKDNAASISSERLDLLDKDKLLLLTWDETAEPRVRADPVFAALKVAKENRTVFVPYNEPPIGAALSFVTVLSVPYAIDQLLPLLTKTGS